MYLILCQFIGLFTGFFGYLLWEIRKEEKQRNLDNIIQEIRNVKFWINETKTKK